MASRKQGRVTMRRTIFFALLPAILVAACVPDSNPGYPVTVDRARQILLKTDLQPIFDGVAPNVRIQASKPNEVTWILSHDGSELMRCIATLSEAGQAKTRVALEIKGVGDVEKRLVEVPKARTIVSAAVREKIASVLEGRPIDMAKITPVTEGSIPR